MAFGGLDTDQLQQFFRSKNVPRKCQLLTLVIAATTMTATYPANTTFSNLFMGAVVQANPFKMGEFTPKLDNGPNHCDVWLGNDCPPMLLTLLLLSRAIERAILTVIDQVGAILLRQ